MKSTKFLVLVLLSFYSFKSFSKNGVVLEVFLGFAGKTGAQYGVVKSRTKEGNMPDMTGVNNNVGYKIQLGYRYDIVKKFSFYGYLGYLNHKTKIFMLI